MSTGRFVLLLVLVGIVVIGRMSVFAVNEWEHAVKFRFGEVLKDDYEPGLHFKPPYENVLLLERRILTINNSTEEFLTNEKKNLLVTFFVKWRIEDPAQYYRATNGRQEFAAQRLIEIIKDGIRAEFAIRTVQEVVTAQRTELVGEVLSKAAPTTAELGVVIVDVRVKRLDLPDEVSESVFNRMRQERVRVANLLRAEGHEASERIRAEADREAVVIRANARKQAQITRGAGDAKSAEVYANAYNRNREFYNFHRSMQAYRDSLGGNGDVLVLQPDSDFFKYLNSSTGQE